MYCDENQRDFARQLRNVSAPAEKRLWHFLQRGRLGVKFRRQAAIGEYIVDFVRSAAATTAVAVTGRSTLRTKVKTTTHAEQPGSLPEDFA